MYPYCKFQIVDRNSIRSINKYLFELKVWHYKYNNKNMELINKFRKENEFKIKVEFYNGEYILFGITEKVKYENIYLKKNDIYKYDDLTKVIKLGLMYFYEKNTQRFN